MARWQDDKMARWQDDKMARWQDGKMARWQDDKMGVVEEVRPQQEDQIVRADPVIEAGSNQPLLLRGDDVWLIERGKVDLFAVQMRNGEALGVRHHLWRAEAGQALFGLQEIEGAPELVLVGVGVIGTQLTVLSRTRLLECAADPLRQPAVADWLDQWVTGLYAGVIKAVAPRDCKHAHAGDALVLVKQGRTRPHQGVLWGEQSSGAAYFLGRSHLPVPASGFWPLSHQVWVQATEESNLSFVSTAQVLRQVIVTGQNRGGLPEGLLTNESHLLPPAWPALDAFHNLIAQLIHDNLLREVATERERLKQKAAANQLSLENAFTRLAGVLEAQPAASEDGAVDPLLAAAQLVGRALGMTIQLSAQKESKDPLRDLVRASRIRVRQVALKGEWWRKDNGPLLLYWEENKQPLAALPAAPHGYDLVDPTVGSRTPLTPTVAAALAGFGHTFYHSFAERVLSGFDLLKFGLRTNQRDLATVLLTGLLMGLLAVATPLATGILFDTIIPSANHSQLLQISLVLLVSALATALFQITQNIALLRIEGKMDAKLQAAVWDRLISLPVAFFRNYTAGDLGNRAMSISTMRQTLSGITVSAFLAGLFSIFSFALLFYYDARLAWVASLLVGTAVVITAVAGYVQVRYQRELTGLQGRISGMVLQLITGIAKFRVAGTETRAFTFWASAFSEQKRLAYQARMVGNSLTVFNAVYPLISAMIIFALVTFADTARLSTGAFLGFNAAFTQFLLAALQVSSALIATLRLVPQYERIRPILTTLPEANEQKLDPGELSGAIEVSHVAFRYREGQPLILKDVSLQIRPGEFVALVGPSGSGKSTLLRLLLGFDTPEAGAIYYDGQDLAGVDIREVRRQIGVVLQQGRVMAGTILSNIIGSSLLTTDDAWEAARMAGLDTDIKRMPMGIHTLVSEGGGTLSGGQRQRLLIARAIVSRPRILLFDEATSALDNRTQAIVSESLEKLKATRVVIAHRLSTIINADRIFVFEDGRVVQSGAYKELMQQPGLFAELARRQVV